MGHGSCTVWDLCFPAWKAPENYLRPSKKKEADQIISRVFGSIISTISKLLKTDTWRRDVFFSVGEAATSKWTHGEVMEKWLFLVLLYTKFSRLNAKSCALRSLRSIRAWFRYYFYDLSFCDILKKTKNTHDWRKIRYIEIETYFMWNKLHLIYYTDILYRDQMYFNLSISLTL